MSVGRFDRWSAIRYSGLGAAFVLAIGSYFAGALPGGDPGAGLRTGGLPAMPGRFLAGLTLCVVAAVTLTVVWWRCCVRTHHASPQDQGPGYRWLVVTGTLWMAPMLVAAPLGARDIYSYACQGWLQLNGVDPYAVGPAAGECPWLEAVAPMWRGTSAPYGPLGIAVSAAVVWLVETIASGGAAVMLVEGRSVPVGIAAGLLRLPALLGVALIGWSGIRLANACRARPKTAFLLATTSPLVMIHAIAGAHHDALMTGLVLTALGIAARHATRAVPDAAVTAGAAAGGVLGLAIAVKITAIVALPFVALLVAGTPSRQRRLRWARPVVVVVVATVGGFAATAAATGLGLGWANSFSATAGSSQWTSLPTGVGLSVGYLLRALGQFAPFGTTIAAARAAGIAALLVIASVCVVKAAKAASRPRTVVAYCGVAFAAATVLAPVFYPWYALAPLAILAAASVATRHVRWLLLATTALVFVVLPNGLGVAPVTKAPGSIAIAMLTVVIVVMAIRRLTKAARSGA